MYVYSDSGDAGDTGGSTGDAGDSDCLTGRHFVWRELTEDGKKWRKVGEEDSKHNKYGFQEDDILDIYAKLDPATNILTLYVLAAGGMNDSSDTQRPDTWPKEATPSALTDNGAKDAWLKHDYSHHVVYVSRATWKLNNIPPNFTWN